jgi:membrane-associated phospholipid phosphatase
MPADRSWQVTAVPAGLRLICPALSGILFVVLTIVVAAGGATPLGIDQALSDAARSASVHHPALRAAMAGLTHTGGSTPLVAAGALAAAVLLIRGMRREAAFVGAAAASTTLARWLVRAVVARPRPAGGLDPAHGWAYPSGHTTSSTVAALIAVALLLHLAAPRRAGGGRRRSSH